MKKKQPFKLNFFGVLGILLFLSGIFSGYVVYLFVMSNFK
tara:strand:+ start:307 stop:426 length:120 start_codon:yes stop_codon:yes gene_type:complete